MKREVSPWREEDLPRQAENSFTALDVRVTRRRLTMEEVEMEKVLMSVRDRMSWREVGGLRFVVGVG
ncbi:hypothetical protein RJZ90_004443, partial [Blastomyces dermatitidis]